ncbi:unannotated protein [freshwater metagenome]|uniref:Unannotated protein n=1 Tax=freshwater metagenome TaxID=449393 RepID=A0A6J6D194_9ZZZZ
MGDRQLRHGDHAARSQREHGADRAVVVVHLAVAAQAVRVHRHRGHHRAVPAHRGTERAHERHPGPQHGDVGRGAADVGDDRVVETGEVGGAHEARCRTRQDRLDRTLAHERSRHQRPVTTHHHHRCVHALVHQGAFGGGHQPVDDRHQTGVQDRRHGAARPVQLLGQHVARRHRRPGDLADHGRSGTLVRRVAHAELRHHRKAVHAVGHRGDLGAQPVEVERGSLAAVGVVTARQQDGRVAGERVAQAAALDHLVVEADDHRGDRTAGSLHERVGGERGGERHQLDAGRIDAGRVHRTVDRSGDADAEVVVRGRRLRLGDHDPRVLVVDDGVGVRATGVDAEQQAWGAGGGVREGVGHRIVGAVERGSG